MKKSKKKQERKPKKEESPDWFQAALQGDLQKIDALLEKNTDPNSRASGNATALMHAAHAGHQEIVDRLLSHKADPNLQENKGYTALMIACKAGHTGIAQKLIHAKADVSLRAEHDLTALILACQDGRVDTAKLLLENGADANAATEKGATSLLFAAAADNEEVSKLLLQHGALPNTAESETGHTPLLAAARKGSGVVRLLIEHGADVNAKAFDGKTPLMVACGEGNVEAVKFLLAAHADVNAVENELGLTPLMAAAVGGKVEIVRLVIENGADVNAQNKTGHTSLMYACRQGFEEIVRLLLEHHANVFLKNQHREDALMHAKAADDDAIVALVAEAREKQLQDSPDNAREYHGRILLDVCSLGDTYIEQVRFSLKQGADPEIRNTRGFTPLLMAAYYGYPEITRALLEAGADVNAVEDTGGTPLYWACFGGRTAIAGLLLEKGARLSPKVWEAAQNNSSRDIMDLLMSTAARRAGIAVPQFSYSEYQDKRPRLRTLVRQDPRAAGEAAAIVLFFDPDDLLASVILGMACNAAGDTEKVQQVAAAVAAKTFGKEQVSEAQEFLEFLLKEQRYDLIRYGSGLVTSLAPENAGMLFTEAVARGAGGDAAGARSMLERVVELKPDHFDAWYNLGVSYMETEQPQKAVPCFDRALALSPDNHTILFQLAAARESAGDEQGALRAYEDAYRTKPTWGGQRDYTQQIQDALARLRDPRTHLEGSHTRDVECIDFSSDGKLLASGSLDCSIRIWNAANGDPMMRLDGHRNRVDCVVFSPDRKYLASWECLGNTYFLWNAETGKRIKSWSGESISVWRIAFSPDSAFLAVEAGKTNIALVDVGRRTEVKRMAGHTDEITSIAFHPGGNLIASGSRDQTVRIWDVKTSQQIKQFEKHRKVLGSVAFSPDGRFLACGGYDGVLCLWEVDGWREVRILELGDRVAVKNIVFSPVDRLVYFIAAHTVQTLDPETGEVKILIPDISVVPCFALSPDARWLATGHTEYKDYRVAVWDVATKREIWKR